MARDNTLLDIFDLTIYNIKFPSDTHFYLLFLSIKESSEGTELFQVVMYMLGVVQR